MTLRRPHCVHVMPSFGPGGAQIRTIDLIHHFGKRYSHTILSLSPDLSAAERIDSSLGVQFKVCPQNRNSLQMIRDLIKHLRQCAPDVVFTYNWGAIDAVVAARVGRVSPVIHTEDGFGDGEAHKQYLRRVWARRWALRFAHRVVSPSRSLTRIMKVDWRLPEKKIAYIPNGIDTDHFAPSFSPRDHGELVIGTVGHLRPEKHQEILIASCAELARRRPIRLLIAGEGPERRNLERFAQSLNVADRVHFLGYQVDVQNVYKKLDIFALTSSTEQMPYAVLEAMACGLPVVSTDVGDVKSMVSPHNAPMVVPAEDIPTILATLADDSTLRSRLGEANRIECVRRFSLQRMLATYAVLYGGACRSRDAKYCGSETVTSAVARGDRWRTR